MAWNIIPKETLALVLTCQFHKKTENTFLKYTSGRLLLSYFNKENNFLGEH